MTHDSDDRSLPSFARRLAGTILPWLVSCTVHLTALLVLALGFETVRGMSRKEGPINGLSLQVHLISRSPLDIAMQGSGTDAVELRARQYFPDESGSNSTTTSVATRATTARVGGARLVAMLNERPQLDLGGMLPAAASTLGTAGLDGGGVGNAGTMSQAGRPSVKYRGGYARTGVFGVKGEGQKFVYVFDRSGSMEGHGGLPLASAKAELISSLRDLEQVHQFQIIFYNEKPRIFNPTGVAGRLVFASEQNKQLARQFVASVTADGGTQHEDALIMGLAMHPDVLFFLTDADEPRMTRQQMDRIRKANSITSIFTIEFGYGPQSDGDNFLVRLAQENRGQHVYVDVGQLRRPQ